ncbi:hypothetical protein [Streptococcus sinensis]|uniref:hypothetical protein n=1 Tax=Streptococcus sinensis TaxID=176090 RepID=UPI001C2EDE65|nr:hypothetical protein [Streptococcus sinensis]MCD1276295.1 hypothetical protein [Streptococcus sinensis]
MKKSIVFVFTVFILICLSACSILGIGRGETYRGKWKAQSSAGENIDLVFEENTGKLGDKEFHYVLDKSGYEDNTKYYSITVNDTYHYTIAFPDNDLKIAVLLEPDDPRDPLYGEMLYAMNRQKHPDFQKYIDNYLN